MNTLDQLFPMGQQHWNRRGIYHSDYFALKSAYSLTSSLFLCRRASFLLLICLLVCSRLLIAPQKYQLPCVGLPARPLDVTAVIIGCYPSIVCTSPLTPSELSSWDWA